VQKNWAKVRLIRLKHRAKRWGLSLWDLALLLALGCAICGKPFDPERSEPHFDHDHAMDKFRGLLCNLHNTGLGAFKDDPNALQSAIAYLAA
jgi:hypothetical protein